MVEREWGCFYGTESFEIFPHCGTGRKYHSGCGIAPFDTADFVASTDAAGTGTGCAAVSPGKIPGHFDGGRHAAAAQSAGTGGFGGKNAAGVSKGKGRAGR